jgi:hypothetical protein
MRQQIYSSVRVVSQMHNYELALMTNNFQYSVLTVSASFFKMTTEYLRLA